MKNIWQYICWLLFRCSTSVAWRFVCYTYFMITYITYLLSLLLLYILTPTCLFNYMFSLVQLRAFYFIFFYVQSVAFYSEYVELWQNMHIWILQTMFTPLASKFFGWQEEQISILFCLAGVLVSLDWDLLNYFFLCEVWFARVF